MSGSSLTGVGAGDPWSGPGGAGGPGRDGVRWILRRRTTSGGGT